MAFFPGQNSGSSGKKVAIGTIQVSGTSKVKYWLRYHNYAGYDYDFKPTYLFLYKMFPDTVSGSDGALDDGTHINVYDDLRFPGFAYRAAIAGTVTGSSFYRTKIPASTGGNRIYDVGKDSDGGYFEFAGNTTGDGLYFYVAVE